MNGDMPDAINASALPRWVQLKVAALRAACNRPIYVLRSGRALNAWEVATVSSNYAVGTAGYGLQEIALSAAGYAMVLGYCEGERPG